MNSQAGMMAPVSGVRVGLARTTGTLFLFVLLLFTYRSAIAEELELRYYGAEWCAPCRKIEPMIERWAEMHTDLRFVRLDYDTHEADRLRFGFVGVPVLVLLKGDEFVGRYGHDAQRISDFARHRLDWWFESMKENVESRQP